MSNPRVIAVVVAWNRAALLRETLDGLAAQTRPLDGVVVVDNASSDETPQLIASHPVVSNVVTLPQNYGGAGGFAAGIARAMTVGADLVWIMDDDTIPTPTALEVLLQTREEYPGTPAVLACRADWIDGREHPMNAPRERFLISRELREHAAAVGARQIRTASFVAIMIDARAIEEEGLPEAAYFLWNDDFEYTARLLKGRVGLYVDGARVEHRTETPLLIPARASTTKFVTRSGRLVLRLVSDFLIAVRLGRRPRCAGRRCLRLLPIARLLWITCARDCVMHGVRLCAQARFFT